MLAPSFADTAAQAGLEGRDAKATGSKEIWKRAKRKREIQQQDKLLLAAQPARQVVTDEMCLDKDFTNNNVFARMLANLLANKKAHKFVFLKFSAKLQTTVQIVWCFLNTY